MVLIEDFLIYISPIGWHGQVPFNNLYCISLIINNFKN